MWKSGLVYVFRLDSHWTESVFSCRKNCTCKHHEGVFLALNLKDLIYCTWKLGIFFGLG